MLPDPHHKLSLAVEKINDARNEKDPAKAQQIMRLAMLHLDEASTEYGNLIANRNAIAAGMEPLYT